MGHIFISYSHTDTKYAHTLADDLQGAGLDVWIDERIDYGSQWPYEIQKQLDGCDAFILIMTPRSFASEWVQSELQRAKRKLKPIFPLLLEGDEPWLSVESTQYYDVRDENLPDERFYSAIKKVVNINPEAGTGTRSPKKPVKTKPNNSPVKMKTEVLVALIGGGVTIFTACVTLVFGPLITKWVNDGNLIPTAPQIFSTQEAASEVPGDPDNSSSQSPIDIGIEMVLIPEGEFTMGLDADAALAECEKHSDNCNRGDFTDEGPPHQVYLDAFYMDTYEVTNAYYKLCVDAGACEPPIDTGSNSRASYYDDAEFDHYPVIFVSWEMAQTFCEWRGMNLPTEAQWEKAARGTDHTLYPWGEEADTSLANYDGEIGDTVAAGNYGEGQSPYGLYDMAGNVWEWVMDWYSEDYYGSSPLENPLGPESGMFHTLRGGSWYDPAYLIGVSVRLKAAQPVDNNYGFRCASSSAP